MIFLVKRGEKFSQGLSIIDIDKLRQYSASLRDVMQNANCFADFGWSGAELLIEKSPISTPQ